MGLTSQYLKYDPVAVFGLVTSGRCPPACISPRVVATGCVENVLIWNVITGERVALLRGESSPVTFLAARPGGDNHDVAVGYQDGSIALFNVDNGERQVLLHGHKRAIQTLSWNAAGTRLASGSLDTDIIIWDAVEESGLYRLKGHKEKVNALIFLSRPGSEKESFLISASSDRTIKIWELESQHCQATNIHHKAQINCMTRFEDMLVCGSDDAMVRFFNITFSSTTLFEDGSEIQLKYAGTMNRTGTDKTTFIHCQDNLLFATGIRDMIDIWQFNNADEVKKRVRKRVRKAKRAIREDGGDDTEVALTLDDIILEDRIGKSISTKSGGKLRGLSVISSSRKEYKIIAQHSSNQLQIHTLKQFEGHEKEVTSLGKLTMPGHRDQPRSIAFSHDNRALVSGSNDSVKVWSVDSCKAVRSVKVEPVVSVAYCKGDRQVLAGTKTGKLLLIDIATADIIEEIDAHEGEIWQIKESRNDWATVSTDGLMKLWKLDYKKDTLTMKHTKTLQLKEAVLSVEFTKDGKFIAVALMDSTVKVFYRDTLKFWNSLYGHHLPVNCLAASDDSTLMVTGSADRAVKLWGMDFADCHKSFIAHDKGVVSVCWVFDTHLFFSMGKDGSIKQWDGDNYQLIQKLTGHHDEINSGTLSNHGDMVCTVSKDRSIRLWERNEELVVLEEEDQKIREQEAKNAFQSSEQNADLVIPGVNPDAEATITQVHPEIAASAAERLIDAIEIHHVEGLKNENDAKHPVLVQLKLTSKQYIVKTINDIHQQELESALLLLPMQYLSNFMKVCCDAIEERTSVEKVSYVLCAIQRLFFPQLTSTPKYAQILERTRKCTQGALSEIKDVVDFNFAVLSLLQNRVDDASDEKLFVEAVQKKKKKDKRRKKNVAVLVV